MRLYGQEAVLDDLVPRLVGLGRENNRRFPYRGGAPVVHLVGGRGGGKTALLDELAASYLNRVPLVRADLAAPAFGFDGLGDLPGDDRPNASHLTSLLYLLSGHLQLGGDGFRSTLKFRRLPLGLLVVTSWLTATAVPEPTGDGQDPAALFMERMERLRAVVTADSADRGRRKELLRQWFDALAPVATAVTAMPPGADTLLQTAATSAREAFFAPRGDQAALHWWNERLQRLRYQGDPVQKLYWFGQAFQYRDQRRDEAEKLLTAALLADIDDHYNLWRRMDDVPRPLLLIDNIDALPGDRFTRALKEAFGHLPDGRRAATHPVFVVTGRGTPGTPSPLTADPAPDRPWVSMGLPRVGRRQIQTMLGTRFYPPGLPLLVERLSGDRAGVASALLDAYDDAGGGLGPIVDQLRSPTGTGPVAGLLRELVNQLFPGHGSPDRGALRMDPAVLDRLRLLATALDRTAAIGLLTSHRPETDPVDRVDDTLAYVAAGHPVPYRWPVVDTAAPFVADRALRDLLLLLLRAETSWADWGRLHRFLRDLHPLPGDGPHPVDVEAKYLHHALALGDSAEVGNALHRRFLDGGLSDWLAVLNVVCAAPRPPDRPAGAQAPAVPACGSCGDPAAAPNAAGVHLAITRLLNALWAQSSPLAVPDEGHIAEIESQLEALRKETADTDGVLRRAWLGWPGQLRLGVQAPDLDCGQGGNA